MADDDPPAQRLLYRIWDEVKDHRQETRDEFRALRSQLFTGDNSLEARVRGLEGTNSEGSLWRRVRDNAVITIATLVITGLVTLGALAAGGVFA